MKSYSTEQENEYKRLIEEHLRSLSSSVSFSYFVNNFAKYCRRQELSRFLFRHELFKIIAGVKGSIIECGVFSGNGLMTWAQLSAIIEPMAFFRQVYGFDTFEGFPTVSEKDLSGVHDLNWKPGDLKDDSYKDLVRCIELFDMNRFLAQFPKVQLIKGDFVVTAPKFLGANPHVLVALLYLDFDLYEPTKKALQLFLPRMCKGSVLAFDEINNPNWPGETLALLECLDLKHIEIRKLPYEPNMAYIVL